MTSLLLINYDTLKRKNHNDHSIMWLMAFKLFYFDSKANEGKC